ncbi:MAG: oxidoreductase, partial [Sutterella sp.]|nr:oxidoreductase [Sutterella sp.]
MRDALALAGLAMTPLAGAVAAAADAIESMSWCACVINCGQRCPLRCFTKHGRVIRIETDATLPDDTDAPRQIRACQRGRSMIERIYSPDRLKYPMKRVG